MHTFVMLRNTNFGDYLTTIKIQQICHWSFQISKLQKLLGSSEDLKT